MIQDYWHTRLRRMGKQVWIVHTIGEFRELLTPSTNPV
jgi:hypothetical protein